MADYDIKKEVNHYVSYINGTFFETADTYEEAFNDVEDFLNDLAGIPDYCIENDSDFF